ncbi:MAG TPA: C4-type zinc ribbon domain-containing protein [Nitrospirota bacterium]|nr:C4-type zinc ribbon domain-containing protein [Nitrospirota bacterium]
MEEHLSLLIQLQEIDTEIRSLNIRKNQLPEMIAAMEEKRTVSKKNLDGVKEALLIVQKDRRDREQDLESGIQKIERLKGRASEIKTNKEYQALLKEIEAAEQENKAIEDEILFLMEKMETATAAIAAAEINALEEENNLLNEQRDRETDTIRVEEDLKAAEQRKKELTSRIEPTVLAKYQRLLLTKASSAVVEVHGESCSGCFMSIPPQVFVNVKKNENIITCPQCGRILYYKG